MIRLLSLLFPKRPQEGEEGGFRWRLRSNGFRQYYCKDCQGPLSPGPEGCGSLNAVCRKCKVNHGCLPFFWDQP